MNKDKIIAVLAVVAIAAIGAAGYMYFSQQNQPAELNSSQRVGQIPRYEADDTSPTPQVKPPAKPQGPEAQKQSSDFKTYTNSSLGFSIKYPADIKPTLELNDEYNRLTMFGDVKGKHFEVRLQESTDSQMGVKYGFLGAEILSTSTMVGGVKGYTATSQGYADMGSKGVPYVDVGVKKGLNFYHLLFYGDQKLNDEEKEIISSFKFLN